MKRLTLLIVVLLFGVAIVANAQEAIEPGVMITGTITNEDFAVEYTWEAKANDVIVIELARENYESDFDEPLIIVNDAEGTEVIRYDGYGRATAVVVLPADGTYTIIATRTDEATGASVGNYTLKVSNPTVLELGTPIEATIINTEAQYYIYQGEDAFNLSYSRTGEFSPEIAVNEISEFTPGYLTALGALAGESVTQGTMGTFEGGKLYIISVKEALFSFYFDDVTADYTLGIDKAE